MVIGLPILSAILVVIKMGGPYFWFCIGITSLISYFILFIASILMKDRFMGILVGGDTFDGDFVPHFDCSSF